MKQEKRKDEKQMNLWSQQQEDKQVPRAPDELDLRDTDHVGSFRGTGRMLMSLYVHQDTIRRAPAATP